MRPIPFLFLLTSSALAGAPTTQQRDVSPAHRALIEDEAKRRKALLLDLEKGNPEQRLGAIRVLAGAPFYARDEIKTQVPFVVKMLDSPDAGLVNDAIWAAHAIGPAAGPAVPILIKLLRTEPEDKWKTVAEAIGAIGVPAVDPLAKLLDDPQATRETKRRVLDAFLQMGEEGHRRDKSDKAKAAIPVLEKVIRSGDVEFLMTASIAIDELDRDALAKSEAARESLPVYLRNLKADDTNTAAMASRVIGGLGSHAAPAIPSILEFAKRLREIEQKEERAWAGVGIAGTVIRIGPAALPRLAEALRSDVPETRCLAATLMNNFMHEKVREQMEFELPESAVPALLDMLKDEDRRLRLCAVPLLGSYGPRANEATPLLLAMLDVDEVKRLAESGHWKPLSAELHEVRRVVEALEQINRQALHESKQAEALVAAAREALDRERDPGWSAMKLLGHLGPSAAAAVPQIVKKIVQEKAREGGHPTSVVLVLKKIGQPAVPRLVEALREDDPAVRQAAAFALWGLGSIAREAIPALDRARKDQVKAVRDEAELALRIIRKDVAVP
jgi:HEAT repeat protein